MRLTCLCVPAVAASRAGRFVPEGEGLDARARDAVLRLDPGAPLTGRVLASPYACAVETATLLGLSATIEPALRDAAPGAWSGLRLDQVDPALAASWLTDPDCAPPGGESRSALSRRISEWLHRLPDMPGGLLVVTHAPVIRALLSSALGFAPEVAGRIDVAPLSRTLLSRHRGWRLQGLGLP